MSEKNLFIREKSYFKYLYNDYLLPQIYPYSLKLRSTITGEKIVHVVGDSHTLAFLHKYPFIVHHIGPATAYNLDSLDSATNSRVKLGNIASLINPKNESILLVFGEIDCRIHIYNQYRKLHKKLSIPFLIKKTIDKYGLAMKRLRAKNINFYVSSVVPAGSQGNIYNYKYYASFKQRALIHHFFNQELEKYCKLHNYPYLNLYKEIVDENGGIKTTYLLDKLHINANTVGIVRRLIKKANT